MSQDKVNQNLAQNLIVTKNMLDNKTINKETIFQFLDVYFASNPLYKFQHDSYDQFINDIVFPTMKESSNIITENIFQNL